MKGSDSYSYDALYRLTGENSDSYTYDAIANRLSGKGTSYTYPSDSSRLSAVGSSSITTDAAGNITQDAGRSYVVDAAGHVKSVSMGGVLKATYTYDANNQRVKKVTAGTTPITTHYVYGAGGLLYGEYDASGHVVREYIYLNGVPFAQVDTSGSTDTLSYLHTDHLGTPRIASNSSGASVWAWDSDAFGNGAPTGSATVNLRFAGQYWDAESGLHYNWNRYYDPATGRYISSDPIGLDGGLNTFGYALANPVVYTDPEGLATCRDGKYCHPSKKGREIAWDVTLGPVEECFRNPNPYTCGLAGVEICGAGKALSLGRKLGKATKKLPSSTAKGGDSVAGEVRVSRSKYPESSDHIREAQKAGHPDILTVSREGAKENRKKALSGHQRVAGKDRDEYPPAIFKEGGNGASVKPISPKDNRGAGSCIGHQCRKYPDGTKIQLKVVE